MREGKTQVAEQPEYKSSRPSRQQETVVSMLHATAYVRRFGAWVFEQHDITSQQYNVLRILRGAGPDGLPTLDIAERMIEQTPGITRLLDRLEARKLVRRERCPADRRQVLCWLTGQSRALLKELEGPVDGADHDAIGGLESAAVDRLIGLLDGVRGEVG